jgi:hypothetical protein
MYDNFNFCCVNELFLQLYEIVPLLIIFLKPIKNMKNIFFTEKVYLFHKENFVIYIIMPISSVYQTYNKIKILSSLLSGVHQTHDSRIIFIMSLSYSIFIFFGIKNTKHYHILLLSNFFILSYYYYIMCTNWES